MALQSSWSRVATSLIVLPLALASTASHAQSGAGTPIPQVAIERATQLRADALDSDLGYRVIESLTTEVGPRLAGSEADARAVAWAQAKFKALGYDKVWLEPVTFPKWERRSEQAAVLGDNAQPLVVSALGGSPAGTVEGTVVRFADFAALEAVADGALAGQIAFVDFPMERKQDGAGYGAASRIRSRGPSLAARKGAAGFLMRSAGTDLHRNPHTGLTRFEDGQRPIPAAALSVPDAQQLSRLLAIGPQRVRVALDCGWDGTATSHNVIGEITGRGKPREVVLIGGHLDSWDLGTGAVDDASGVGITMAAGALIGRMKTPPARSIRVVAFANEEQGLHGARAYAATHADAVARHAIAAESDFGAGRIYAFATSASANASAAEVQIAAALAPLGITHTPGQGGPGPDLGPFVEKGLAWATLRQDGTDYFDLHHTPDDTLDKVDPKAIAQNVAAYAVFAYLSASAPDGFGSAAKPAAPKAP